MGRPSPRQTAGALASSGGFDRPGSSGSITGPSVKRVVRPRGQQSNFQAGASFAQMPAGSLQPVPGSTLRVEAATELEALCFSSSQAPPGSRGAPLRRSGSQQPTVSCSLERIPSLLGKENMQKHIVG